jgi:DNA ligase-1
MSRINTHGDHFSPMLYPNEAVGYEIVTKPMMASYKLDGMRCIFKNGEMLSRQFKPILNKQLNERFEPLKKLSLEYHEIYDGELYSHEIDFQGIMHYCRTEDLGDEPLPESINFYCFDCLSGELFELAKNESARCRYELIEEMKEMDIPHFVALEQRIVSTPEETKKMFEEAISKGFEGLILKNPMSTYKFGRISVPSGDGYKFKPYQTFDGRIVGVEQATEVDPTVERKVGELGYHKTSRKKGDRIPIEKASAFRVRYEDREVKVSLAMTDEEKEKIWREKDSYTGKYIEYKGMLVGAKDLPRHPVFIRFREDKDGS